MEYQFYQLISTDTSNILGWFTGAENKAAGYKNTVTGPHTGWPDMWRWECHNVTISHCHTPTYWLAWYVTLRMSQWESMHWDRADHMCHSWNKSSSCRLSKLSSFFLYLDLTTGSAAECDSVPSAGTWKLSELSLLRLSLESSELLLDALEGTWVDVNRVSSSSK